MQRFAISTQALLQWVNCNRIFVNATLLLSCYYKFCACSFVRYAVCEGIQKWLDLEGRRTEEVEALRSVSVAKWQAKQSPEEPIIQFASDSQPSNSIRVKGV